MRFAGKKILLLVLFLCFTLLEPVYAQESGSLFLLPSVSQSSSLNPAKRNKTDKLVIGIPVLSGSNFSWNTSFPLDALFSGGLWTYSFHDFYANLDEFEEGQSSAKFDMFYAGLNFKDFTFTISLSERAFAKTFFDKEIVKLIRDGIQPYYGKNENFGSGSFNFNHYRELAFGISQRYWKQLDIGIRPKILFGRTYYNAQNINFSVETDNENQTLLLEPEGSFTMAAPVTYSYDSVFDYTIFNADILPGDYSFNYHNMSFAIDIGVVFRPNQYSEIGASLVDLGFTGYKHNTYNIDFVEPIKYSKENLYQSHTSGADAYLASREALRAFSDSVSYVINVSDKNQRKYNILPFKINLYGKYNLSPILIAGVNNQFSYYGKQSINTFAGFLNVNPNSKTELGASLSIFNFSDILLGLGASYTAEKAQYYISTNNIFGIIQTAASKHLNLSFGINFLFNTTRK